MTLCMFCGLLAWLIVFPATVALATGHAGTCLFLAFMGLACAAYGLWADYLNSTEGY